MKKHLLFLFVLVFLYACQKDSTTELQPDQNVYDNSSTTTRGSNKRDVCHNGNIINVNVNAIPAHQRHGDAVDMDGDGYFDIANPCSETDCDDATYDPANSCGCVENELKVQVDPDGIAGNSDDYTLYVFPVDNGMHIPWSNNMNKIGVTGFWDGFNNTNAITANQGAGTYAARICADLRVNGCEWYLPATNELKAVMQQLGPSGSGNIPGATTYWAATETFNGNGGGVVTGTGHSYARTKIYGSNMRCRCVRK